MMFDFDLDGIKPNFVMQEENNLKNKFLVRVSEDFRSLSSELFDLCPKKAISFIHDYGNYSCNSSMPFKDYFYNYFQEEINELEKRNNKKI